MSQSTLQVVAFAPFVNEFLVIRLFGNLKPLNMEIVEMEQDVKVFCVTAKSFPDGIQEAFTALEKMLTVEGRHFYGISSFDKKGLLIYKAAVSEVYPGEAEKYGFETATIEKGKYLAEIIQDWKKHIPAIGDTFRKLMEDERVVKPVTGIEYYKSFEEMVCMVKVSSE